MDEGTLEGACSCGRNQYIILAPRTISVIYDNRAEHSRSLSLRVPLSHIRSTTYAFYPGETHSEIRRVFTPRHAPHTKRHFCGFCGTPLTHWSEENEGDADWVHVNLNSLRSASVEKLSEEGLLTSSHDAIQPGVSEEKEKALGLSSTSGDREIHGAPWFQEMIEGSELGRIKHKRGVQTSTDGRKRVEWEVVDFSSELKENENNTSKRKLDQVGKEGDSEMRG
ncbi:MAG: hypothetical protein L6R40_005240 [Gallowayella cf. fulva]|nr:MAG: hypothetical protein L6R40_005240 [Xanthomendoza cf. fulva]